MKWTVKGNLTWKDKCEYRGQFEGNEMHGEGTLIFQSAQQEDEVFKYQGNFDKGKPSGNGTIFWTNGDICKGDFKDNTCTGAKQLKDSWEVGTFYWRFPHHEHILPEGNLKSFSQEHI